MNEPKPVKNYRNRNTIRHPYTKSKRFDATCRNHGSCPYCESNRKHKNNKRKEKWTTTD